VTLAIEINDAGLAIAADGQLLAEEPGYAMLDGRQPETGHAAAKRMRLAPVYSESRHWAELGDVALPRTMPAATTFAEVAHAQLSAFAAPWQERDRETMFAVPPWYTREQLSILLGVAKETGLEPVGLVDAGLAAASLEPVPESVMQLELSLHRAVLTLLDYSGGLHRSRFEIIPRHGWLALQQAWLEMVAASFVRKTRFDPLHDAATEQQLLDQLPAWLDSVREAPSVTVEIEAAGTRHSLEIEAQAFAAAAQPAYRDYLRVLQQARPAGAAMHLRLSHRLAALPGLSDQLAEIRDCEVVVLPPGAAAIGALAWELAIRRNEGGLVLVQRLPTPLRASSPSSVPEAATVPAAAWPTHLVHRSRAYVTDERPITLGTAAPPGKRVLTVAPGPGISRSHCTVLRDVDGVWLEDHSTYGTFVNEARINGRVQLRAGDRLRLGSPGVVCELVRVVDDDGATQD